MLSTEYARAVQADRLRDIEERTRARMLLDGTDPAGPRGGPARRPAGLAGWIRRVGFRRRFRLDPA